jgi:hypothetical protein
MAAASGTHPPIPTDTYAYRRSRGEFRRKDSPPHAASGDPISLGFRQSLLLQTLREFERIYNFPKPPTLPSLTAVFNFAPFIA